MDQIQASCPECYSEFGFPINSVGQWSECPECGAEFKIEPDEVAINDHYFNPPSKAETATPWLLWGCGCAAAVAFFLILGGLFLMSFLKKGEQEEEPNFQGGPDIETQRLEPVDNSKPVEPGGDKPVSANVKPKQESFKTYLRDTYGISEVYFNGDTEVSVVLPPIEYKRGKNHVRNSVGKKIANEYAAHIGMKPVTCIVLKQGKMYVKTTSD